MKNLSVVPCELAERRPRVENDSLGRRKRVSGVRVKTEWTGVRFMTNDISSSRIGAGL